jgi:arsenate reductase
MAAMSKPKQPREYASSPCMLHEFENMNSDSEQLTIYHNPACSKSRETLALIRAHDIEPRVVEYLKAPLGVATLRDLVERLKVRPQDLVRREEAEFKEHFAGKTLDDEGWLKALAAHPKLMQRPIVVRGKQAVLGRPPANVLPLLKESKAR